MDEENCSQATTQPAPEFSVIVTCYNEEQSIQEFHDRLHETLESLGRACEIIFVNDGSRDGTFVQLEAIFEADPQVSAVLDLYWNSGKAAAMTAGFSEARGKTFVFIDSDLQLDPEELPLLLAEYDQGHDLVSGYRRDRKDPFFRKVASAFVNVIMRRVSANRMRDFGCSFKVLDGEILRAFQYDAFKVFRPAYVVSKLERCSEVAVTHHPRRYGKSGWGFATLAGYFLENMVGIWQHPFQILGVVCLLTTVVLLGWVVLGWVTPFAFLHEVTPGLMFGLTVFNLLVMVGALSTLGEFMMRYYGLRQPHPAYVIRRMRRRSAPGSCGEASGQDEPGRHRKGNT